MSCCNKKSLLTFPEKDPEDVVRYGTQYSNTFLGDETINTVTFEAPISSGLTITDDLIEGNQVSALFAGGNLGTHNITVTITTNTRTLQRTIRLPVRNL